MQLNFNEMLDNQKYWRGSENLIDKQKEGFIILYNKLIKQAIDNAGEVDNVKLYYLEDYADARIFREFATVLEGGVFMRKRKKVAW